MVRTGIRELLPLLDSTDRALDIGCGTAEYLAPLAERLSRGSVVAVDRDANNFAAARQWVAESGLAGAVAFVEADAHALPFGDAEFNLVTCYGMLHGVVDPGRVLTEMVRVLKPGAHLVLFTFAAFDPMLLDEMNAELKASGAGRLSIHPGFDPRWLCSYLEALGMREISVRNQGVQTIATPPYTAKEYKFDGLLLTARRPAQLA